MALCSCQGTGAEKKQTGELRKPGRQNNSNSQKVRHRADEVGEGGA